MHTYMHTCMHTQGSGYRRENMYARNECVYKDKFSCFSLLQRNRYAAKVGPSGLCPRLKSYM